MDPASSPCMRCGQVRTHEKSFLLTDCNHLLCSCCAKQDVRGPFACCVCHKKCSLTQLRGGNPPEKLRALLRSTNDLIPCFSRAHIMQARLKAENEQKIKQRTEKVSLNLEKMEKEATCLAFLSKKGGKFLEKFERSCKGGKMTAKFEAALETFSEIDLETDLEEFLTNFSDTSDSTSTDEAEGATDTEDIQTRKRTVNNAKRERPERPRPENAKQNQYPKGPLEAPKRYDPPGAVRNHKPPKEPHRERPPNPRGNHAARPPVSPAALKGNPARIVPGNRQAPEESRHGRFEPDRGFDKRNSDADSYRRDGARQPAQARKPTVARDPARRPQRPTEYESAPQRHNRAMPQRHEPSRGANVPRRRKYDGAFAD